MTDQSAGVLRDQSEMQPRTVVWFSAGAASAVAAKLAIAQRSDVVVAYCDPGSEHEDNPRFIDDCEAWFGQPVTRLKSEKYTDTWDVFDKTRYLVGAEGARCTTELKKVLRHAFQRPDDEQVFGYTSDELKRVRQFEKSNPEVTLWCPLVDAQLSHADCLAMVERAGIELPAMYALGYRNNNCIGCPKGAMGYWNKIRVDFPEVFDRMALVERELGIACNGTDIKLDTGRRKKIPVFLDELDPDRGDYATESAIECGVLCASAEAVIDTTDCAA